MRSSIIAILLIITSFSSKSQEKSGVQDSILNIVQSYEPARARIDSLLKLMHTIRAEDPIAFYKLSNQALLESQDIMYKAGMLHAYSWLADIEWQFGHFNEGINFNHMAVRYGLEALNEAGADEELDLKIKLAACYSRLVENYCAINDENGFVRQVGIMEEFINRNNLVETFKPGWFLSSCASCFLNFDNDEKAIIYYGKARDAFETYDDAYGVANITINIAMLKFGKEDYDKALEEVNKGLSLYQSINNAGGVIWAYNMKGSFYVSMEMRDSAEYYFNKSYQLAKESGDNSIVNCLFILSEFKEDDGELDTSIALMQEAVNESEKRGLNREFINLSKLLKDLYAKQGKTAEGLRVYEKAMALNDSLDRLDQESTRTNNEIKQRFAQAKIEQELSRERALLVERQEVESSKRRNTNIIIGISIGLLLVAVFGGIMFNRFRLTKRQRDLIELQRKEVSEKNKEILDSIKYAKRIQSAILPPEPKIKKYLSDSFVLYKPKDIVSGDFYWLEPYQSENENESGVLFAACDCTGHGVPGAMVSVVCNNGLNRSVREHKISDPGAILNKTREIILEEFSKSGENVRDGMDVALCSLSVSEQDSGISGVHLQYAGANNPAWIVRADSNELIELKGDKMPIGRYAGESTYSTQSIELNKGDMLYLFTDGYIDQFGGESDKKIGGKKFKAKRFKELLRSIAHLDLKAQGTRIDNVFEEWKGDLEQLDDVCVIGVRV